VLARVFHHWERRLAAVTTDRVTRPFEWGLDWIGGNGHVAPNVAFREHSQRMLADSATFFAAPRIEDYARAGDVISFTTACVTPHLENNTVYTRFFPAEGPRRRAVLVLPQWNADRESHVALCRWLARAGISALRLSLPYHDDRMPPELSRADYIVSANVGRTLSVCRQAVVDARGAIAWLAREGYERIGILGTSLGSCLAMLTAAHEPLVVAAALNHISPYFADVVWEGLSTAHVRAGLDRAIPLDVLRACWLPISPQPYIARTRGKRVLLVYAKYDLSFPVDLSRQLVDEFRRCDVDPEVFVLPCGHYSTGIAPFSWIDGYVMVRFLMRNLG
jgi:dienelactone hydrolase